MASPDRRERLAAARLYLVCPARPRDWLEAALRGGVDVIQLRDKEAGDEAILAAAPAFRAAADAHGALFVLNDRPDLVAATGADGVHVGQDDLPVGEARAIVGDDLIVGRSTHSPAQVDEANGLDVDYIACGPLVETPTKPGRPAAGLDLIGHAAAHARVPWFAIGGIDPALARRAAALGAERIVVVRAITEAPDPEAAARELRAALEEVSVGTA
jgi:thiamine-phosphate pyrophosphorylase